MKRLTAEIAENAEMKEPLNKISETIISGANSAVNTLWIRTV